MASSIDGEEEDEEGAAAAAAPWQTTCLLRAAAAAASLAGEKGSWRVTLRRGSAGARAHPLPPGWLAALLMRALGLLIPAA